MKNLDMRMRFQDKNSKQELNYKNKENSDSKGQSDKVFFSPNLHPKIKKKKNFSKFLKISAIFFLALFITAAGYFTYRLSQKDLYGWRLNFSLNKVETSDYKGISPTIAFKYPRIFEIDLDQNKKYGENYVVGIKLKTDNRTGCDIRRSGPQLDFSRSNQELEEETTGPIKSKTTDFKLLESGKKNIGDHQAYFISFSFMDPIGARVRLDQFFLSGEENFMLICGTGEYQYAFFQKDFRTFYDSINFNDKSIETGK